MKAPLLIAAVAVLTSALSVPAFAHSSLTPHLHVDPAPVATTLFKKRPAWAQQIDRSILHPIPKPYPWPGPVCLTCPNGDINPGKLVNPVMR